MAIWTPNTPGSLSNILTGDDAQDEAMRSFEHGSTEPATKVPGLLWSCTNSSVLTGLGLATHALLRWNGSAWQRFMPGFGGVVAVLSGGFLDLNGAVPTNMGTPTGSSDGARNGDVLKKNGSVALTADWDVGNRKIRNLGQGSGGSDAARLSDIIDANSMGSVALTGTAVDVGLTFAPRAGMFSIKMGTQTRDVAPLLFPTPNVEVVVTPVGSNSGVRITSCNGAGSVPLNFFGFRVVPNAGGSFVASSVLTYMVFK
jgi:hypothetical protein